MKIRDESILFFSRVSLSKFSLKALFLLWVKGVFILGWEWNVKSQVFHNRAGSQCGLAAWVSRKFQPRDNWMASCPILSCSGPASMTLQLLACLAHVQLLAACSCESPTIFHLDGIAFGFLKNHTLYFWSLSLFPSRILVCATGFCSSYLFTFGDLHLVSFF